MCKRYSNIACIRTQGSYKALARYTQGSYNSVVRYSTPSNRRQLQFFKSQKKHLQNLASMHPYTPPTFECAFSGHPPKPPSYSAGALPGIDSQGSYTSVARYSTSSSLSVSRSITFTHVQQSTALKSHGFYTNPGQLQFSCQV